MTVEQHLPWLLSAVTVLMTLLAGSKHPSAWAFGLLVQALWLLWIARTGQWGFLPMNLVLWAVYLRNHLLWRSPAPAAMNPGSRAAFTEGR